MRVAPVGPSAAAASADVATGLFVPSDWGRFWKPKRNGAKTGQAVLAAAGDSITQGHWSSSLTTKSYLGLVAAALQSRYGDGGSGHFGVMRSTVGVGSGGYGVGDYLQASAGWTLWGGVGGYGAQALNSTAAFGSPQTLTFQVRGTKVSVRYLGAAGNGVFSITIDGNSFGSINTNTASGSYQASASGLTAGLHTVVLTVAAGQPATYISGVRGENSTGVVVDNFGKWGVTASSYASSSPFGNAAAWSGGPSSPCDCLILSLGVNDANAGTAADTYLGNMAAVLRAVRDGGAPMNGKTDVVILAHHIGQDDNATPVYWEYVERLYGLAYAYGAALVDMWAILQNSYAAAAAVSYWSDGTSDGLPGANAVHPGDAGHQAIANAVLPVLLAS